MNAYAKARQLNVLLQLKERIGQLVEPDVKLIAQVDARIAFLSKRMEEEVNEDTGEIR